ncbi:N-6 DNA methylase, partial [Candidatus Hodarchaeum mangrovi]
MAKNQKLNDLNLGAVFTPIYIVEILTELVLKYLMQSIPLNESIYILDHSVGDGRFLIECWKFFRKKKYEFQNRIKYYGVDLNPQAIREAKLNISKLEKDNELNVNLGLGNSLLGYIKLPETFNLKKSTNLLDKEYISQYSRNSFIDPSTKELLLFHWGAKWPEINQGFHCIIGNPPYGIKFTKLEKEIIHQIYKGFDPE